MAIKTRHIRLISLVIVMFALFVLGQSTVGSQAAGLDIDLSVSGITNSPLVNSLLAQVPEPDQVTAAVNCTDTTCPSAPSGLDKCVERPKFCVYYTTASISQTEAEWAADTVQDYWDRFVALGFNQPKYSTKLEVHLSNTTDCNGGSDWYSNAISTYAGCFDVTLLAQKVLGHELTHRVQYAHDSGPSAPIQTKFLKEGTARATEDNWFTEIDHWAAALSYSSFNTEANNYLLATQNDITSYDMRYKSCLWWKYAMEQYGTTLTEPQRGIDFVRQVYNKNTAGYSGIAAVNQALSTMGTGANFDKSFKQFAVAIWTKDLTGVPGPAYNFVDEDEVGSPGIYGPLVPTSGGTIQVGTSANWNNQGVNPYALRYYSANIGLNCPVVSASFHKDDAGPAFYHVITQNGTAFNTHVQGSGVDWTQSFLNNGITKVVAVVGSLGNSSQVDLTLSCADPVIDIKLPNNGAVARVQPSTKFLAQVLVTNGSISGPVVAGLTNSHFSARVNGVDAPVTGGGFIQEQYWLLIQAPSLADGTYDLEITLEDPVSGTPFDTDTNANSVVYTTELTDQVLIVDRSGSMGVGSPTRLSAAKDAAAFYVDVTRDGDGLSVVPYNHDINPAPFNMDTVDPSVRTAAKGFINALTDGGLTSIGDGLSEAISQVAGSPTGNTICSFVLLSDGMENEYKFWSDVRTDVIDSGCPVTAIAFGPESDETLMQTIATDTGGLFFYNDVYVSSPLNGVTAVPADMSLDLGNTYEYAQGLAEGRQRLLAEKGVVSSKDPENAHKVMVDETNSEVVFSLDWYETWFAELELVLIDPNGKTYDSKNPGYTFADFQNNHVGFRILHPEPGVWQLLVKHIQSEEQEVPYQVMVSGRTEITLELLLPDRLGKTYATGNRVPIYAILSSNHPILNVLVQAFVTAPDGTQKIVPLYDDGQHDDGAVNDGLYAGVYTAVNQAEAVKPTGEDDQSIPNDEGSYRVVARATHEKFQREALGAFSVLEGPDDNKNRLPDTWEKENLVSDPNADPDMDALSNYGEYVNGTDPNDPDTDDGGEKDGSEVNHSRDPLNPSDDLIARPDFLQVQPWKKAVLIRYDFKPSYNSMRLFRAMDSAGPWTEVKLQSGLPPSGMYTDMDVKNGQIYFYRTEAVIIPGLRAGEQLPDSPVADEIVSAVLTSEGVIPTEDPILPEAHVMINNDEPTTTSQNVVLTFTPYENEGPDDIDAFSDITWVMISNNPGFSGAVWQPFQQGIPWVLQAQSGEVAHVYARFRDKADNQSIGTETDSILYQPFNIYMPMTSKGTN